MAAYVCVITGKGHSAIGSVALYGPRAMGILSAVFVPAGKTPVSSHVGKIYHGQIRDGDIILDDVVVGCEGENVFVIHCHGNPIIIEKIIRRMLVCGAQTAQLNHLPGVAAEARNTTRLAQEAAVEQLRAVTLEGVRMIQSQVNGGLSATLQSWMTDSTLTVDAIHQECREILARSIIAKQLICGVRIVLAGPPNSGKSTLLNAIAGSEKAIVSDIAGTTRDWVTAQVGLGPLRAELIDTAGLGAGAIRQQPDEQAQQATQNLITDCDCVILIRDATTSEPFDMAVPEGLAVVNVLNKCDLAEGDSDCDRPGVIRISARQGQGINQLIDAIVNTLGVRDFDCTLSVTFTRRQSQLLERVLTGKELGQIRQIIQNII